MPSAAPLRRRTLLAATLMFGALLACGAGAPAIPAKGPMPAGASWTGVWETSFGRLAMEQKGDEVVGLYRYNNAGTDVLGAVAGKADGNYLDFAWVEKEGGGGKGMGQFGMNEDGRSYAGSWGYDGSHTDGGSWTGTKVQDTLGAADSLGPTSRPWAASPGPTSSEVAASTRRDARGAL